MTPDIHTARLRLNALHPDDAFAMSRYRADRQVARFQSWRPASVEEARAFIERNRSTSFNQNDSWHPLAVRAAATGEIIGDLGVHFIGDDGHQVEIGFTIAPAHQRKGLGAEAVTGLLDYLFTVLQKHRVYASVDPRNRASMALLDRVGMRKEAHFRESLFWKGEWVDDVIYALLRSDWNERRSPP